MQTSIRLRTEQVGIPFERGAADFGHAGGQARRPSVYDMDGITLATVYFSEHFSKCAMLFHDSSQSLERPRAKFTDHVHSSLRKQHSSYSHFFHPDWTTSQTTPSHPQNLATYLHIYRHTTHIPAASSTQGHIRRLLNMKQAHNIPNIWPSTSYPCTKHDLRWSLEPPQHQHPLQAQGFVGHESFNPLETS